MYYRGYVGPGGLHEYGLHHNCTGGAAGYIDKVVLSIDHIYKWPTPQVSEWWASSDVHVVKDRSLYLTELKFKN